MNIEMKALVGILSGIYDMIKEVCFTGTPTCVAESDYDNHSRTEKTVLTFHSVEVLPIRRQLAFIVTDAQGDSYVIGHAEDPFPTVKVTHSHGTPAEEKAGFTYEVKLIGRKTHVVTGIMRMFAFFVAHSSLLKTFAHLKHRFSTFYGAKTTFLH
jgi:hypothetical protein